MYLSNPNWMRNNENFKELLKFGDAAIEAAITRSDSCIWIMIALLNRLHPEWFTGFPKHHAGKVRELRKWAMEWWTAYHAAQKAITSLTLEHDKRIKTTERFIEFVDAQITKDGAD